ncbi:MAG: glycosyltransferase family 4 protein [Desulfomonilaceae bacterium]|nr:glycosyltransferase family 4 protein [Desulfomonilaceae bacterium]
MKIAMALENFSRHAGGAESYAVELANTLASEGWEVHLYGHSWDGHPENAIFHEIPRMPKWVPPSVRILDFALRHRAMVRAEHFDVVLGFGNTIAMNVYQSHGGVHYLSSVRKIGAIRNPVLRVLKFLAMCASPKYHLRARIESAPFRSNQRPVIIAISDMVRNDMADYFGIPKDSIKLVYNGIDHARFGRADRTEARRLRRDMGFDEHVLFLFMAYDFRKKGVRSLVQAASVLRDRVGRGRFGVVVVGRPPSPALGRMVRRLQLSDIIVFPGQTTQPELYYHACDVFVLPTFYDACSLVVFEAMAAGLPAITTIHNGASGIMEHGVDGMILQDANDIGELAEALSFFLDDEIRGSASSAARRTAARYTLERNHREMIAVLTEAARARVRGTLGSV